MIHYTEALTVLIADIVSRVEPLAFIDLSRLLVFARPGRTGAEGAYATCHSLNLPTTEPGYYFWRDRRTGEMTRRSPWFVTKTPEVWVGRRRLDYLLSFSIPRFCDQTLQGSRKAAYYPGGPAWLAKLDTVVHELYHIAPGDTGLRKVERADGGASCRSHGPTFFEEVAACVRGYLATRPDPARVAFLRDDFRGLTRRYGAVAGLTFRNFPSYPQRFPEVLASQPDAPDVRIVKLAGSTQPRRYTDKDLQLRCFTLRGTHRVSVPQLDDAA
jgi:hypothetical protein